ncbi:MAG: T9SS type A sorting domain-containing protein [Fidelibacterota bacterium]
MKKHTFSLAFIFFITLVFAENPGVSQVVPDFWIESSSDSAFHNFPAIGVDKEGNFVVVWTTTIDIDSQFSTTEIWGRLYRNDGSPLTPKFRINDKEMYGEGAPMLPTSIDVNNAGNFIITWGLSVIYFQQYNSYAEPQGNNIQIKAVTSGEYPAVGMDRSGNFTIAWANWYTPRGIYAQRFGSEGDSLGIALRINQPYHEEIWNPAIAMNEAGDFIIVWKKGRYGEEGIHGQLFKNDGTAEGANFKISDDTDSAYHGNAAVAIDSSGDIFAVVWQDNRLGDYNLYCQLYRDGEAHGTNFIVNEEDNDSTSWFVPAIAMDKSGCFVITWADNRSGTNDIYGQCYDSSGKVIGKNFIVNTEQEGNQGHPAVALKNGYIFNTWTDGSIWANIIEFPDLSGFKDENKPPETLYQFKLFPNYPNPFNSSTSITFVLKEEVNVIIKIFNILGKETITLVNEIQPAGYRSVIWDGTDHYGNPVSSGVYLCIMTAGDFTELQKMLLMK